MPDVRSDIYSVGATLYHLLVRIPGVYLTSIWFPDTLFPMGITTACGSLTSIIICLLVFRYLKKKPIRTAV